MKTGAIFVVNTIDNNNSIVTNSCPFCDNINPTDFIAETIHWTILLSIDQTQIGRCIVALKRHCEDLADLTREEWDDYIKTLDRLESTLRKTFDATLFNWSCLMNMAYQDANPAPHVHWHVRPRYNHTVHIDKEIFEDTTFGYHYDSTKTREVSAEIKQKIISRIQENW